MCPADSRSDLAELQAERMADASGMAGLDRRLTKLADGHPSSPRYDEDSRKADRRPLTDLEHAAHAADVKVRLADALKAGLATHFGHTIDRYHDVWSDEREAMHDSIIDDLYGKADRVPRDHRAILAGGLAGAGKTTVLTQHAGIDLRQYLMINPDQIKGELARRGMIPEVKALSPMEAAQLVHEESSHISKRLAVRAQSDGRNVIWDITMASRESTARRIDALRTAGYTRIDAIFVDVPIETSLSRADTRHRRGHDEYEAGRGLGGRYTLPELVRAQADPDWGSINRRHFDQLKFRFDAWSRYDNSVDGRVPLLVESSRRELVT